MPKMTAKCQVCNKTFEYYSSDHAGKYCSRKCWSTVSIKNLKDRFLGLKHKAETIGKMKVAQVGEIHHSWKGEQTGYTAIHKWVERHKGKPSECVKCGNTAPDVKYEWANIDHKYKRNLDDYIRLCCACHREYDASK